jgi:DNA (cytosine-5)-methyltransferase 1
VANEFVPERAQLFRTNFPETLMLQGDIRELGDQIVSNTIDRLGGRELDILFATPPCQGMSKNGRGKLLRGVRDGLRNSLDPRNQLATFVPPLVNKLKPKMVVFENVPEMLHTLVENLEGDLVELLDLLASLMPDYSASWKVIEFADYGVPQRRQRLITIFVRRDMDEELFAMSRNLRTSRLFPIPTNCSSSTLIAKPWVSVLEVIGYLPQLDAAHEVTARDPDLPFHYVPILDERKYWWVKSTPAGSSAFDNQCVNPTCMSTRTPTHSNNNSTGINRASTSTPIYCVDCGQLLPRPTVEVEGEPRLMKGFTSAYKRMRGDMPASALTRNLSYACSDQKLHPNQNRVLSLLEAMKLHTITDYDYRWSLPNGKRASDKLIRESIGESIPPRGLELLFRHLFAAVPLQDGGRSPERDFTRDSAKRLARAK